MSNYSGEEALYALCKECSRVKDEVCKAIYKSQHLVGLGREMTNSKFINDENTMKEIGQIVECCSDNKCSEVVKKYEKKIKEANVKIADPVD